MVLAPLVRTKEMKLIVEGTNSASFRLGAFLDLIYLPE